jgi:hypothetical protein
MDNKQAVEVIRSNWPDARYSTLREALELSIKLLEAEEPAQLSHNTGSPKLPGYLDFHIFCDKEGLFPKQAENIYRYIVGQLRAGA